MSLTRRLFLKMSAGALAASMLADSLRWRAPLLPDPVVSESPIIGYVQSIYHANGRSEATIVVEPSGWFEGAIPMGYLTLVEVGPSPKILTWDIGDPITSDQLRL